MSKFWNLLKISPVALGAFIFMAGAAYAAETREDAPNQANRIVASGTTLNLPAAPLTLQAAPGELSNPTQQPSQINISSSPADSDVLRQLNRYSNEATTTSQVTSISQLRDVSPRSWAFEALRSLVERYQCIAGYPDGTFQGDRALTRFEFAAGLNACLRRIEALVAQGGGVTQTDLEAIRRLVREFQTELAALGTRINALEGRVRTLESRQFSTTTRLQGEAIFQLSQTFNGQTNNTVAGVNIPLGSNTAVTFSDRVRLNLNTSFSGNDLLNTRLQARNIRPFSDAGLGTQMAGLSVEGSEGNSFQLGRLVYQFTGGVPLTGVGGTFFVGTTGLFLDDVALNLNPTGDAVSNFGANRPIYNIGGGGGGAGISFNVLNNTFRVDAAYVAGAPNIPSRGSGLFNGPYAAIGQITYAPENSLFKVALTYSNTYGLDPSAGQGTFLSANPFFYSQVNGPVRTTTNNYQAQVNFQFSPTIELGTFINYTLAIDETLANRGRKSDIWSYGVNLAFRDVGTPGSVLGLIFGVPPVARRVQLANFSTISNSATPYHAEVFYRFNVNDNIDITPGFFAVFRADGNSSRDPIYVGTIRTTFRF
jgi:hypothetical protein